MKRSPLMQLAHDALQIYDKAKVDSLLNSVNLSLKEREVIIRSEIAKTDLETICNSFLHWNKKTICSYPHIVRIKKSGMEKIGLFLKDNKMINK